MLAHSCAILLFSKRDRRSLARIAAVHRGQGRRSGARAGRCGAEIRYDTQHKDVRSCAFAHRLATSSKLCHAMFSCCWLSGDAPLKITCHSVDGTTPPNSFDANRLSVLAAFPPRAPKSCTPADQATIRVCVLCGGHPNRRVESSAIRHATSRISQCIELRLHARRGPNRPTQPAANLSR